MQGERAWAAKNKPPNKKERKKRIRYRPIPKHLPMRGLLRPPRAAPATCHDPIYLHMCTCMCILHSYHQITEGCGGKGECGPADPEFTVEDMCIYYITVRFSSSPTPDGHDELPGRPEWFPFHPTTSDGGFYTVDSDPFGRPHWKQNSFEDPTPITTTCMRIRHAMPYAT